MLNPKDFAPLHGAPRGRHHRLQLGQHRMLRFRLGGSGGRQLQRRPLCGGSQQSVGLHAVERFLENTSGFLIIFVEDTKGQC